ncbi:hypothetical protein LAZ67_4002126 [Cordylochernes scorpioides]|uniref:Integrase zinc-binding domain-containing protein n=1 Tax=Cordylochernes scorpioides TaxID=51811 RepID=A0ABY6KCJ6_9ARAC|nr:hypothetical protein LAZ67_4002126 [Cordylochernes scorpioides]
MSRLISTQYYWQGMSKDIKQKVKTCPTCQLTKRPVGPTYGELSQPPEAKKPFDLLSLDTIAGFAKYGNTKIYLHVVVDHFSRYAWTFPSKSTSIITYQQGYGGVLSMMMEGVLLWRGDRSWADVLLEEVRGSSISVVEHEETRSQATMIEQTHNQVPQEPTTDASVAAFLRTLTLCLDQLLNRESEEAITYDGDEPAAHFFSQLESQPNFHNLEPARQARKALSSLRGEPRKIAQDLALLNKTYEEVKESLCAVYPRRPSFTLQEFYELKCTSMAEIETYYKNKVRIGLAINLPKSAIVQALSNGVPRNYGNLLKMAQPSGPEKWLCLAQQLTYEGDNTSTKAAQQRSPRQSRAPSTTVDQTPPYPCRYCGQNHCNKQCRKQPFDADNTLLHQVQTPEQRSSLRDAQIHPIKQAITKPIATSQIYHVAPSQVPNEQTSQVQIVQTSQVPIEQTSQVQIAQTSQVRIEQTSQVSIAHTPQDPTTPDPHELIVEDEMSKNPQHDNRQLLEDTALSDSSTPDKRDSPSLSEEKCYESFGDCEHSDCSRVMENPTEIISSNNAVPCQSTPPRADQVAYVPRTRLHAIFEVQQKPINSFSVPPISRRLAVGGRVVGDLIGHGSPLLRVTRAAFADEASLSQFTSRLLEETCRGSYRVNGVGEAIVLRGTATPFQRLTTRPARRMLERPRPHLLSRCTSGLSPEACIACGSGDLSLATATGPVGGSGQSSWRPSPSFSSPLAYRARSSGMAGGRRSAHSHKNPTWSGGGPYQDGGAFLTHKSLYKIGPPRVERKAARTASGRFWLSLLVSVLGNQVCVMGFCPVGCLRPTRCYHLALPLLLVVHV